MSEPHKKRLKELEAKEGEGTINEGERIEMKNIRKHLNVLESGNPLNDIEQTKKPKKVKKAK